MAVGSAGLTSIPKSLTPEIPQEDTCGERRTLVDHLKDLAAGISKGIGMLVSSSQSQVLDM